MNIQFFNPPSFHYTNFQYRMMPALALPILSALFNQAGHYAEVVDLEALHVTPEQLKNAYANQKDSMPDVIGITALTSNSQGTREIIKGLREAGFAGRIVVGGPHVTTRPQDGLDWGADLVVTGECEGNVLELFESNATGIHKGIAAPIDAIPSPDWGHHNPKIDTYWGNTKVVRPNPGISMWSRGCPYQCIFCSNIVYGGQATRYRDPLVIGKEMKELKGRGCKNVYVYDDELVGTRIPDGWMEAVADQVGHLHLPWVTQGRCSERFINAELMHQVKRAGCKVIFWGVESFSEKVLEAVNKRTKPSDIWHTLRLAKEAGIANGVFTMVGSYKETDDDLAITRDALSLAYEEGLIQYRQTTVCTGMPGTPLEKIMKAEGWWNEPPPSGREWGQQYYKPTPWLSSESIIYWMNEFERVCPRGDW